MRDPFDDHDTIDLDTELSTQRDERVSPLILGAGIVGLAIGLFVWGSLTMSVLSAGNDFLNDVTEETPALAAPEDATTTTTPTPEPSPEVTPTVAPTANAGVNREDCGEIRGTDYRTPEERSWFLANCVQ